MAKRSSSSSSSGFLLKVVNPSYYLRKPHRLAFLCLFIVIILFVGVDRQYSSRELEALSSKLVELETEKEKLEGELTKVQLDVNLGDTTGDQTKHLRAGGKSQPLILGVTTRGGISKPRKVGVDGSGSSSGTNTVDPVKVVAHRKLLPDDVLKATDTDKSEDSPESDTVEREDVEPVPKLDIDSETSSRQDTAGGVQDDSDFQGSKKSETAEEVTDPEQQKAIKRKEAIRWGMIHAWGAYEQYAWGFDELQPQSKRGVNQFGGLGATIVDSLDTLHIMGLTEQFDKAKGWVFENMDFNKNYDASVFETTIRVLGGLISAYDLSGDEGFLLKARELADRLLPAWDTPTGLPWNIINLRDGRGYNAGWTGGSSILADSGTTTVEMIALSRRLGDSKYAAKAEKVIKQINTIFPADGLVPLYISPQTGQPTSNKVSMGAMGDSFYEYLLKVWVQGGKTEEVQQYREMWEKSMEGMKGLIQKSDPSGLTYVAERVNEQLIAKMDHLACFIPGMLVLGAEGPKAEEYLQLAKELARTCYEFYDRMPSKLSGEHYIFRNGQDLQVGHAYNIGRPETVESLFYLWRKTKDPIYREWGWNIWQAFEMHCRLPSGYTGLQDVSQNPPVRDDMMQSFFLAETLKYLYLLFSEDDVIPLDEWVFNTEAHPVKINSLARRAQSEVVDN